MGGRTRARRDLSRVGAEGVGVEGVGAEGGGAIKVRMRRVSRVIGIVVQ